MKENKIKKWARIIDWVFLGALIIASLIITYHVGVIVGIIKY